MTPPADPENQPLAERDLEIAAILETVRIMNRAAIMFYPDRALIELNRSRSWAENQQDQARDLVAKARELCGYNAGAAAMREALRKALLEDCVFGQQNIVAEILAAVPTPPDPTTAMRAENKRLSEALQMIAKPLSCGCNPCTSDCRSDASKSIYFDEAQEVARAALGAP